ncbi:MAG: hypothetical protein ACFE95_02460 [Candidatus Hodarchaeota archaeon]
MEQPGKTLRTDQKLKIITSLSLIAFSFLPIGIIFDNFKAGFVCSLFCLIIIGIIESSYNQEELDNPILFFSLPNFLIIGSAGIGIISIIVVFLFLI